MLIDPFIQQGQAAHLLAKLKREGAWGTSIASEDLPQLDPWVTWTTLYTGRPQEEHNVFFLQQSSANPSMRVEFGRSAPITDSPVG